MALKKRRANLSDTEFIYQLKKEALFPYVDEIWGWDESFQQKRFDETLKIENIKILVQSKKPIGILEIEYEEDRIKLVNIEIIASKRNKGIGKEIINELINQAFMEGKYIVLRVFKLNEKAIQFYRRLGFIEDFQSTHHVNMKLNPRCSQGTVE